MSERDAGPAPAIGVGSLGTLGRRVAARRRASDGVRHARRRLSAATKVPRRRARGAGGGPRRRVARP
jgi:hypothetical protein